MARLCLLAVAFALETHQSVSLRGKALGLPISTCGGSADAGSTEQVQMEQQHGKPCKFPFVYNGVEYNECTEVDSGGVGAWVPGTAHQGSCADRCGCRGGAFACAVLPRAGALVETNLRFGFE